MPASRIPNFLSFARLVAAPLLLPASLLGTTSFLILLGLLLLTDGLDGMLARRLGAQSARGRLLDSWADHVTCGFALVGVWRLWPAAIHREGRYVVLAVLAYGAPVLYSLARFGRLLAYHTLLSRVSGAAMTLALPAFLFGWSSLPFRVAAAIELLVALEYVAISILLPEHCAPMRSLLEARRLAVSSPGRSVDPAEHPS